MIVLLAAILYVPAFSQLQYEHTYGESANLVQLEGLGEAYYSMDVNSWACYLYRMDHSLMKTITLSNPGAYYLADIQHVSQYLFNDDEKVELVYTCLKYIPTELSYYTVYESKVINEDGAVLLTLPGVGFTQVVETSAGKKLLAYEYYYSTDPWQTRTLVYGLPDHSQTVTRSWESDQSVSSWPNPADRMVNIAVGNAGKGLPGTLVFSDLNGRTVLSLPVSASAGNIGVPVSDLPPGTYLFRVRTDLGESTAGKLIIAH